MAEQWYYTRPGNRERLGPVGKDVLRNLASSGELSPQALVWRVGMAQWAPASTVAGLFASGAPAAVVSAAATREPADVATTAPPAESASPQAAEISPPPQTIGYYSGSGRLPPRPAAALLGHATPRGDVYDWPLDDIRVAQFEQTVKLRKKVSAAAQLYRALLLLSVITAVIFALIALFAMGASSSSRARQEMMAMFVFVGVLAGFSALYYFTWRATERSQRWAPLTMFIIFMLGVALNLIILVVAVTAGGRDSTTTAFTSFVGMILPALFAFVSWRAYGTIPTYLMQPAWCQELIVKAKL
jgi:hypothetical protein